MSTPLAALLRAQIQATGPLTVEEYMEACLYHQKFGYYTNGYNFIPHSTPNTQHSTRDFTTAPELTPLFGATLANWAAKQWHILGQTKPFILMECGPGRGSLMHALLTHLQSAYPQCYSAAQPHLIETSPTLTQLQNQTLSAFPHVKWHQSPVTNPQSPIILIANELLDAFPHSQLIEHEGRIQPRTITLNEQNDFTFSDLITSTNHESRKYESRITEHSPQMRTWLQALPQTLEAAIFLDYGAATTGPTGDTLQAVHRHQKVSVFHLPGESDLTTHVNFTGVTAALKDSHPHLEAAPLDHLAPFLLTHGLASLALEMQSAEGPHPNTDTLLHRLLHPSQMGTLFKVQCLVKSCSTAPRP